MMRNIVFYFSLIIATFSCSNIDRGGNELYCDSLFSKNIIENNLKKYQIQTKKDTAVINLFFQDVEDLYYKRKLICKLFCYQCKGKFYKKRFFSFVFYENSKKNPLFGIFISSQSCYDFKNLKLNYPKLAKAHWYIFDSISNENYKIISKYSNQLYKQQYSDSGNARESPIYFAELVKRAYLNDKINGYQVEKLLRRLYFYSLFPKDECPICGKSRHFERIFKILGKESIMKEVQKSFKKKKLK